MAGEMFTGTCLGPQWSGNQQQRRDESSMRGVALETLFLGVLVASALPEVTAWAPLPAALTRNPTPLAAARRLCALGAVAVTEDAMRARALVSTEWLQEQMDRGSGLVLLDVRGKVGKRDRSGRAWGDEWGTGVVSGGRVETTYEALKDDYRTAHIPGAVFIDWTRDIVDSQDTKVPVQLAPLSAFVSVMQARGVSTDRTVVVYDTGKMLFATRLWWALTLYGHSDVRILDGGWKRWQLEGRDTASTSSLVPARPAPAPTFDAHVRYPHLRCDAKGVRRVLPLLASRPAAGEKGKARAGYQLIDARGRTQWNGSELRAKRGGRIPGAVNLPYKVLIDAQRGGFLPLPHLRGKLRECGVSIAGPGIECQTVAYCNGGVASTAVLFVLWQLGTPLQGLTNYDGSWGEWGNEHDEELFPVEFC